MRINPEQELKLVLNCYWKTAKCSNTFGSPQIKFPYSLMGLPHMKSVVR